GGARGADALHARCELAVAGLEREREFEIVFGVLVPAPDERVGGQGFELLERIEHLLGRALEQPPAPRGGQRMAPDQVLAEKIRHVPRRMPRNEENAPARLADRDLVALVDRPRDAGNALAVALVAVDRQFVTLEDAAVAAGVVAVVVRVENRLGVDLLSVD